MRIGDRVVIRKLDWDTNARSVFEYVEGYIINIHMKYKTALVKTGGKAITVNFEDMFILSTDTITKKATCRYPICKDDKCIHFIKGLCKLSIDNKFVEICPDDRTSEDCPQFERRRKKEDAK